MRLLNEMEKGTIPGGNFTFTGIRTEHLGASEYTLATIAVDISGSVSQFKKELKDALITAVESCKKSPRSDNLLIRVILFSDSLPGGVVEIHGFKPLADIDTADYKDLNPGGLTPLADATFSAIGATNTYAKQLYDKDFLVNAIIFIITDGGDNASAMNAAAIKKEVAKGIQGEFIESMVSVLIGINAATYANELQKFQADADITQFIDAGDATPSKLAKLADFVSQSISSQSQALGSNGPSQNISTTI